MHATKKDKEHSLGLSDVEKYGLASSILRDLGLKVTKEDIKTISSTIDQFLGRNRLYLFLDSVFEAIILDGDLHRVREVVKELSKVSLISGRGQSRVARGKLINEIKDISKTYGIEVPDSLLEGNNALSFAVCLKDILYKKHDVARKEAVIVADIRRRKVANSL